MLILNKPQHIEPLSTNEGVLVQVKKFRKELNSGTVSLMLLTILANAKEPLYGYQIAKQLESLGPDKQKSEKQGSLYPVLRNMNAKGLLDSHVEPSESGPPRRYFTISPFGNKVLNEWLTIWKQTESFVNQVIGNNHAK